MLAAMRGRRTWRRSVATALCSAALSSAAGLASAGEVFVRSREALGPYLSVRLTGEHEHRLLLPNRPACVALSRPEARVRYLDRGFPGRLEAVAGDAGRCEASGVLDLERTRDRRPRPKVPFAPRKTAFWEVIHRDGRHALLRGRFPLAHLVGFAGGGDLVAVVADDESCAGLLASERGALEFRDTGTALRLSAGGSRCALLGLARPRPEAN